MDASNGIVDDQTPLVRALIGLTVVTGLVDAISVLGLGHIFTANMPKRGPATTIRQPTPTKKPIRNGPEILNFRPVL
jgi:hypothetical protein